MTGERNCGNNSGMDLLKDKVIELRNRINKIDEESKGHDKYANFWISYLVEK